MTLRRVIAPPPECNPQQAQPAGEQKGALPAKRYVRDINNRWCQHGTNRKADARPARRDRTLLFRKPVTDRFGVRGRCRRLRGAHDKAQQCQMQPASCAGVQQTGHRPDQRTDQEAHLQSDHIDQPAADWLKQGIGQLKRRHYPGVLFGRHVQTVFKFRCQNAERVAGDVVDGYTQQEHSQHPPA